LCGSNLSARLRIGIDERGFRRSRAPRHILAPVLTARQFAVLCRAADLNFDDVRGSLGTMQTYSRHMRDEILDGLPQDQAGIVLTSAADRARSTARERLRAFASSRNEVNVSALANWCQGSARLYIRTVLAGHDNDHEAYDNTIRSAEENR
jgi:hypothetical protein